MKIEKQQVAGYGLHYHANNQLIQNPIDRVLFQCLIDLVRRQLATSLDNQTIILSKRQLSRISGLERSRTLPASIKRLEELGLIKKYKNGILVCCDEYVALVQLYESLSESEKDELAEKFTTQGITILQEYGSCVNTHNRVELLGMSGSSININSDELRISSQLCNSDDKSCEDTHNTETGYSCEYIHNLAESIEKVVSIYATQYTFEEFMEATSCVNTHNEVEKIIKAVFETGKFPESFKNDLKKLRISSQPSCEYLHNLCEKVVSISATVIIRDKNKYKREPEFKKEGEDENSQDNLKKGFEGFGEVEVLDFDEPSEDIKQDLEVQEDFSQQVLKRAERTMKARNSYRNKPFIKVERVKEIIDCLDEVVKSPVDFFLYQFWWGVFDLYCDHYHPSNKIDEEGEPVDDPQLIDWKEMIGAPLPQDEIYALAKNVYEDLVGAVDQGRYVYGDNNEWEVKFNFDSFEDFIPYEIFQWSPCTMQDKVIPALRVAIDKFYNIEASDVFVPTKGDKRVKNAQNKKLIQLILDSDPIQLTPVEVAIQRFYRDFVVAGEENIIDEFTDGKGTPLESGGGLPDHLLKPWCYSLPFIGYNELTGVLSTKYRPCDGIHKKANIFSAESVVEWNERNGYLDTIAHTAIQ